MKFTLSWLMQHLETEATLDEIVERLTMLGLEVEDVTDRAKDLSAFTVGYVVEAKKHPNADKLQICIVETGSGTVQVVCGAPNARTGMKGVFAPAGTHIPGTGVDLKKGNIRGEDSHGMLCSEREMGLSDEHEGIIDLPEDAPVGASFAEIAGLDDPMIEIQITPNRQDCLGVHGIARDLAAAGLGKLKKFPNDKRDKKVKGDFKSPITWAIDLPGDKADACPMVAGRYFRGLKNGPSPKWLQERLLSIGLRPISALVDITNFVTCDLGRPLHVFDADKLFGGKGEGKLTMRLARDGETCMALDEEEYKLDSEMVVIADGPPGIGGVHGIGGIMGGLETGVTETTTNVFLEVALFDPIRVARTARKLGIESDARYRFERGVDPVSAKWGDDVAARLILELCGGEASEATVAGALPDWKRKLDFRPKRVADLGGIDVKKKEQKDILESLGFDLKDDKGDKWEVEPPSWRVDIVGEADLVEEVMRIHGYDEIPAVPMSLDTALPPLALNLSQQRRRQARRALAARGLLEAVTWSFMDARPAKLFAGENGLNPALRLANPISSELDFMRPSILPNLIQAAGRNAARGHGNAALFEVGPQFADDTPSGQAWVAAGVRSGKSSRKHWAGGDAAARDVDVFDVRADAMAALVAAGAPADKAQITTDAPAWYHPGRSGVLRLGPNVLAAFGELHPRVLRALGVKGPHTAFEVYLDAIPEPKKKDGRTRPLLEPSPFQPLERDFAFVVAADVPAEKLVRAAIGADKALVANATIFDVYTGEGVGEGKKSLALSVTLQPTGKTLTDEEIEAVAARIVANVEKQTGGVLRG